MFDDLILHIGMPKTGTTSIQRALNTVRSGDDWTYLDLNPPHSSNPVILRAYGGIAPASVHPGPRLVHSPQAAFEHVTRAFRAVRTPRAVLSAEVMVRLPAAAIASLLAHASQHARQVRATAYIRPPISFTISYVQQFYKTGHAPLAEVLHRAQRAIPADIAQWDHALGMDNVRPYPFARDRFPAGSVVQHFAQSHDLGPLPQQGVDANVSLSDEATRLMVQYRRFNPGRRPHDGRILHRLARLGGAPFRLHPDCFTAVSKQFEATYAWAQDRMDWSMEEPWPVPHPRAIRTDANFDDLRSETVEWLAETTSRPSSTLHGDREAIADAVAVLSKRPTGQSPMGRIARRLRLA